MTTQQVRDRTKDVTRRDGWLKLVPGDRLCAVVKGMGLKKGEKVERIAEIEAVSARRERLDSITPEDVIREGFPGQTTGWFVAKYVASKRGGTPDMMVTRVQFLYIDED